MIFSYFQFLVYILFFNTQRLKQFNVLFCCCPREQLCKYTHSQRALPLCTPGTRLGRQSSEFQRVTMRIRTLQILRMRCKGSNFYANQHYFTAIISLSDSGVCPKPTADAPCSDVAHHSAAPRCGAYPSSRPVPDAVRG